MEEKKSVPKKLQKKELGEKPGTVPMASDEEKEDFADVFREVLNPPPKKDQN